MTIIESIEQVARTLDDGGFFQEAETIERWLNQTADTTKDNMDKHLVWQEVYLAIHEDLWETDLTLSALAEQANRLEDAEQPSIDGKELFQMPVSLASLDDATLARFVVDRIVASEAFHILLATALKGRLRAY
jgi:hypothetical protein